MNNCIVQKKEENVETEKQKERIILKKNKKSGNYSIWRKITVNHAPSLERVRYTLYNVYLPFGCEGYNDSLVLNGVLTCNNNYNHNTVVTLKKMSLTFVKLSEIEEYAKQYALKNKSYNHFIKEIENETEIKKIEEHDNDIVDCPNLKIKKSSKVEKAEKTESNDKKYNIRMYMLYGAKISHSKMIGEMTREQLKNKRCNIDIELGSLWISDITNKYGVNVYARNIIVLN